MKYYKVIGLLGCALLMVSCFLPWTYYADLNKTFNGFFSEQNNYGKPGKFLIAISLLALMCMLLPKIWAKRTNLFICALGVGYAIKSYILFTSCYNAYCPEKRIGIFLMLIASIVMLVASAFPKLDLPVLETKKPG